MSRETGRPAAPGDAVHSERAERDAWRRDWLERLERLEREAFGCVRPPLADYAAFHHRWHARAAWAFVCGAQAFVLAVFWWGKALPGLLLLVAFSVIYVRAMGSVLWGGFLFGHRSADRVDVMVKADSWRALQAEAQQRDDEALKSLATRRWATYRAALAALGEPFPDDGVIRRGAGFRR